MHFLPIFHGELMPTPKAKAMMMELAKLAGFKHTDPDACIAQRICICCGNDVSNRITTKAGEQEFNITAFCEVCFDEMYNEEGDR